MWRKGPELEEDPCKEMKGWKPYSNGIRLLPGQSVVIAGNKFENTGEGIIYVGEHS